MLVGGRRGINMTGLPACPDLSPCPQVPLLISLTLQGCRSGAFPVSEGKHCSGVREERGDLYEGAPESRTRRVGKTL